ncbi:hypothetical protein [Ruthenibacterium lactatiformans]|jgi:hypothetical protein|uniref:hypothetical protein n=1 Tax=Ruthenibacterium lactatiformans TaxID=1550024 RepID=UPI0024946ECC|nr:hypothetical protein [Ruthenibacterium lactatiformans]
MYTKGPSKKLRDLCASLGPEYSIRIIDMEYVIYRDFGNGLDVEISGLDSGSAHARANIYLWDTKIGTRIIDQVNGVPAGSLGDRVNELYYKWCAR